MKKLLLLILLSTGTLSAEWRDTMIDKDGVKLLLSEGYNVQRIRTPKTGWYYCADCQDIGVRFYASIDEERAYLVVNGQDKNLTAISQEMEDSQKMTMYFFGDYRVSRGQFTNGADLVMIGKKI